MSDKPAGGGVMIAAGAGGVGSSPTYVPPTSEGWACESYQNVSAAMLPQATQWTSIYAINTSGVNISFQTSNASGSVVLPYPIHAFRGFSWQYATVLGVPDTVITSQQTYFSLGSSGANPTAISMRTVDKVRLRGHISVTDNENRPHRVTLYRGDWGVDIPDGTGEQLGAYDIRPGAPKYVEFELAPVSVGGERYFQYFLVMDLPSTPPTTTLVKSAVLQGTPASFATGITPIQIAFCRA